MTSPRLRVPVGCWVFAVALGVRGAYLLTAHGPAFDLPLLDADYYDALGLELARGHGFPEGPFWQPPLYPLLLGALYASVGPGLGAPRLVQAVLGALTAVLAGGVGRRVTGRPGVGLAAGLAVALHGPLVFYDGELLSTSLGTFLATLALWLAVREAPSLATAWLCGGVLGLGALALPPLLLLAPVLGVSLARGRPARGVGALVACAALVLCATVANRVRSGEWVLISSNGGINLWLGNNADVDGAMALRPGRDWETLVQEPARLGLDTLSAQDAYFVRKALGWCGANPGPCLGNLVWKARLLVLAREVPRNEDLYVVRAQSPVLWALTARAGDVALPYALLWPLAAAGLVGLGREVRAGRWNRRAAFTTVGAALALALPSVLFFVSGRYRAPLAPVLCVLAALGLEVLRSRATPRRLAAAVALGVLALSVWPVRLAVDAVNFEAELFYERGGRQARLGEDAAAMTEWRRALELRPDYLEAGYNLGLALERAGRRDEALGVYEALSRWHPREPLLRDALRGRVPAVRP